MPCQASLTSPVAYPTPSRYLPGQAAKNIGDASISLGVFDAREEEELTGRAIEDALLPSGFDQRMEKALVKQLATAVLNRRHLTLICTVCWRAPAFALAVTVTA